MRKGLAIAGAVLILWLVMVTRWATTDWTDTQALVMPSKVEQQYVTFTCPAPFDTAGPGVVDGAVPKYPLSREACNQRNTRRAITFVDVFAGAGIGVGLVGAARRSFRTPNVPVPVAA